MRIIGGDLRGKKILDPLDKSTRPLKDLVRESIFNILKHSKNEFVELNNSKILDLFSGTGSFGIECLSRGAKQVYFIENYSKSIELLKKNINNLGLNKKSKIIQENAYDINNFKLECKKIDLIFLDPPFKDNNLNKLISTIKKSKIVTKESLLVIHRNKKIIYPVIKDLFIFREKNYGLSKIIFGKII